MPLVTPAQTFDLVTKDNPVEYCLLWIEWWATCMPKAEWAGWVQAIGSIVAIIAGVFGIWWQLDKQSQLARRSHDDAISRARLYAARISMRLEAAAETLRHSQAACLFRNLEATKWSQQNQQFAANTSLAKQDIFQPADHILDALVVLPNHCAHRIARAYDLLAGWRHDVLELTPRWQKLNAYSEKAEDVLVRWAGELMAISDLLRVASDELSRATHVGAPHPTGQEMFGVPDFE